MIFGMLLARRANPGQHVRPSNVCSNSRAKKKRARFSNQERGLLRGFISFFRIIPQMETKLTWLRMGNSWKKEGNTRTTDGDADAEHDAHAHAGKSDTESTESTSILDSSCKTSDWIDLAEKTQDLGAPPENTDSSLHSLFLLVDQKDDKICGADIVPDSCSKISFAADKTDKTTPEISLVQVHRSTFNELVFWILEWPGLDKIWPCFSDGIQTRIQDLCAESEIGDWNRFKRGSQTASHLDKRLCSSLLFNREGESMEFSRFRDKYLSLCATCSSAS